MVTNPPVLILSPDGAMETLADDGEDRQAVHCENPELIRIRGNPEHIWFDRTHLVEADSRRAEPGKYYLALVDEKMLFRVNEVIEAENHDQEFEPPEFVNDVEDSADLLVLEHCYTLGVEGGGPYAGGTEKLPRFQVETREPLSMGDWPMIPFRQAVE
ncbi:MAG: hypothetical protein ABEH88_01175 [Halobacteriales archaeon]